jgi:integrase
MARTKRRGQGDGSIFKRGDRRWCAIVDLGWENGKRRRKYFYGKTRSEAADAVHKAIHAKSQGLPIAIERQKLGQFLENWLEQSVRPRVRPRTYESWLLIVRRHIIPTLGVIPLQKVSPQHIRSLLNKKLEDGLSAQTVRHIRTVLRRALGEAVKFEQVVRNAAALVDGPRIPHHEIHPLTPEEARVFLESARGERLEALYSVALAVGLRRGEALGLRWNDIDLDGRTLTVSQTVQRTNGKLQFLEPKTQRSRRTISIPYTVVSALRGHRRRQLEERLAAGPRWQDFGLVFTTRLGTPLEPRNVHRDFKRILARAGVPNQRFHDLRHAAASLLLAQGVSPRVVMELLGHSRIGITMDTYSHVVPSLMREAADKMDQILSGEGPSTGGHNAVAVK